MIVSIHVYDDGDIELTRLVFLPKFPDDVTIVDDENKLKKELFSYGAEETRIDEALATLKVKTDTSVIV
jgi:hypothetical protein